MLLKDAERIASRVKERLAPACEKIEIVGSIRRRRPEVHDIDIVAIPLNQGLFVYALHELGSFKMGGGKLIRVTHRDMFTMAIVELDIYVATPKTWATLLLIRTGSAAHNIFLCQRAHQMGMKLHADGSGLFSFTDCEGTESRQAGDTEESIFEALGLPYQTPEERELGIGYKRTAGR